MRVLVAEDDMASAKLVGVILRRLGLETTTCSNGQAALDALDQAAFDLVILDMNLPVVDGLALARAIRERERDNGRHLPLIAVTGHAFPEDRARCLAAGIDDYLTKPLSIDDLQGRVRRWLGLDA